MEGKYNLRNPVINLMTSLYQLLLLNALFILFSLPVLTMGSALKALLQCIQLMKDNQLNQEVQSFFRAFKDDFIKVNLSFLLMAGILSLVCFNLINGTLLLKRGWFIYLIQMPLLVQIILTSNFLMIVLIHFDLSILKAIKVAWIMGNRHMMKSVVFFVTGYLLIKMGLHMPFILIFLYFSLMAYLHNVLIYPAIKALKEDS
ncbi:MAG: DUF624 domain-containing protein [Clostridia bacterium]|nr:DUF624 domain-containing protein [Clostridia bacterium]